MSLVFTKRLVLAAALCGVVAAGVAASHRLLPPRRAAAGASPRLPPARPDTALTRLLQAYSQLCSAHKGLRRNATLALPARFAQARQRLDAARDSSQNQCPCNALADDDKRQRARDLALIKQLTALDGRARHWRDSTQQQLKTALTANEQQQQAAARAASEVLRRKRGAFRFQLHGAWYRAYVADLETEAVQLRLNDGATGQKLTTLDHLRSYYTQRGIQPAMLTNAGMFHATQEPVGLLVADGTEIRPLNVDNPATDENFYMRPNGVFAIDDHRVAHLDSTAGYARTARSGGVRQATQSGPLLVFGRQINRHFSELSPNAKVRSGVGVLNEAGNEGSRVVFLATEDESTFYDFATTFRDLFGCANALFLDGAISRMYLADDESTSARGGFFGPLLAVVSRADETRLLAIETPVKADKIVKAKEATPADKAAEADPADVQKTAPAAQNPTSKTPPNKAAAAAAAKTVTSPGPGTTKQTPVAAPAKPAVPKTPKTPQPAPQK